MPNEGDTAYCKKCGRRITYSFYGHASHYPAERWYDDRENHPYVCNYNGGGLLSSAEQLHVPGDVLAELLIERGVVDG